jgi:hypothetical protein
VEKVLKEYIDEEHQITLKFKLLSIKLSSLKFYSKNETFLGRLSTPTLTLSSLSLLSALSQSSSFASCCRFLSLFLSCFSLITSMITNASSSSDSLSCSCSCSSSLTVSVRLRFSACLVPDS